MNEIRKVTPDALSQIIDNRQPLGLFYALENGAYIGVDNRTGDAWTEAFPNLRRCKRWLTNSNLTVDGEKL